MCDGDGIAFQDLRVERRSCITVDIPLCDEPNDLIPTANCEINETQCGESCWMVGEFAPLIVQTIPSYDGDEDVSDSG